MIHAKSELLNENAMEVATSERMAVESGRSVHQSHLNRRTLMKWEVKGADRETGEDQVVVVTALNQDEAERAASRKGLLIEYATPLVGRQKLLAFQPPKYSAIIAGAMLLRISAVVCALVAALLIAIAIYGIRNQSGPATNFMAANLFLGAAGMCISAVFLFMYAELARAIRDIAQNSFRQS
jgi:hypothetical protein